ncbi:hypothetical protein [Vibrio sp. SCSIO 43137]|uniref:hypothetical protein n=1 Tax=Vibrio sp. SCSIO 43137 TaxID=3021011 RepID=UPI00230780E5|nr:hypothetical protein [Vibrio sp. SCSIO 43137]WCE28427.1 hypothetical protein PK654_08565 [Vibrio sp. SCSIO 43137]
MTVTNEEIMKDVQGQGFETGLAIATDAEIEAGAACGQMAILEEAPTLQLSSKERVAMGESVCLVAGLAVAMANAGIARAMANIDKAGYLLGAPLDKLMEATNET